jgi:hypothetical protein
LSEYCYGDGKKEEQFDETRQGDGGMCTKLSSENYIGIENLEDLGVDGNVILGV